MEWLSSPLKVIDHDFLIENPQRCADILPFVIKHLSDLSGYYPEFNDWLSGKVLPGLFQGERKILLEYYRGELSGLAIVKDTEAEQKLCCLRVLPPFQGTGVGLRLFERAFESLDNRKPLLSIAEEQTETFKKVFKYFGFELEKKYVDYYRPLKDEFSFNGLIDQEHSQEVLHYR
ncbi:GNAT family N-acetyltransferase [Pseudomonas aeruginosa]